MKNLGWSLLAVVASAYGGAVVGLALSSPERGWTEVLIAIYGTLVTMIALTCLVLSIVDGMEK